MNMINDHLTYAIYTDFQLDSSVYENKMKSIR